MSAPEPVRPDVCRCPRRTLDGAATRVDPECPHHGWMCEDGRVCTGPQLRGMLNLLASGWLGKAGLLEASGMVAEELDALLGLNWVACYRVAFVLTDSGQDAYNKFSQGRYI